MICYLFIFRHIARQKNLRCPINASASRKNFPTNRMFQRGLPFFHVKKRFSPVPHALSCAYPGDETERQVQRQENPRRHGAPMFLRVCSQRVFALSR